eukprot:CAMPEP_0180040878 /NCGR_PEP_ID=MMETSP0984-20121128/33750_1 /TAXON_ID=483367 /ORGANISM="non described non described, Strain CCMP 2436" /LENGTH=135 /DNA_ID=CAMNT_0021968259 /DNA_START=136 /DNA_END=540 /DNA_ORIENTATION=-
MRRLGVEQLEEFPAQPRHDARGLGELVRRGVLAAEHRKGLARARLSVSQDGTVVAPQRVREYGCAQVAVDALLAHLGPVDKIEGKPVVLAHEHNVRAALVPHHGQASARVWPQADRHDDAFGATSVPCARVPCAR